MKMFLHAQARSRQLPTEGLLWFGGSAFLSAGAVYFCAQRSRFGADMV